MFPLFVSVVISAFWWFGCSVHLPPLPANNIILGIPIAPIPKTVFITAPAVPQNLVENTLANTPSQQTRHSVIQRFTEFLDNGTEIQFFDDDEMDISVRNISETLENAGIANQTYEAFSNLRPMAYKADLWRYMILWDRGGVYLDMNIHLLANLSKWIDFKKDELVLIHDACAISPCPKFKFWNAMIAARPRNKALAKVIQQVTHEILNHSYGADDLDITGPSAFGRALSKIDNIESHVTVKYKLQSHFTPGILCGGVPRPRCNVTVDAIDWNDSETSIAEKKSDFEDLLPEIVRGTNHYSGLYLKHAVYCDEQGPPCRKSMENKPVICSDVGENCKTTKCCNGENKICVEKDFYWAGCRADCQPGEPEPNVEGEHRLDPWSCRKLNESMGPLVLKGKRSILE